MNGTVAYMTKPEHLEYQKYELPIPEPGAVLVKVKRTNVCGSELHIWQGHHPSLKSAILGHEMIGEVYALGEGVETDYSGKPLKIGDRIVSAYFLTCKKCSYCQEGQFNLCENAYKYWVKSPTEAPHFHGTFATHYYIHPDQYFYKVPDNVPDVVAASANCALSQVYFGIELANLQYGQSIVIQGAGGLGLYAASIAKEKGATVIIVDGIKSRLQQAEGFGADHLIDMNEFDTTEKRSKVVRDLTKGNGADVGLEVAGVPAAFSEGIQLIRTGGKYVTVGNVSPGKYVDFDPGLLTRKAIEIIPIVRYNPWYLRKSLEFLSANVEKYPFHKMLDAEFTLDQINDALNQSSKRKVTRASIVITP